jgi:hypothetical protein
MGGEPLSASVRCVISLGTFSRERVVVLALPNERKLAALVDRSAVSSEREPQESEWLEGRLRVTVLESQNGSTLIGLPGDSVSGGSRYRIPTATLEFQGKT